MREYFFLIEAVIFLVSILIWVILFICGEDGDFYEVSMTALGIFLKISCIFSIAYWGFIGLIYLATC